MILDYLGLFILLLPFIASDNQDYTAVTVFNMLVLQVLDEEAEVFVVKMWRLLIYEIEAKKLGLVK